jgi:hypothetical protein
MSWRTVYRYADAGLMPWGLKIGALRRWDLDEIERWINDGCPPPLAHALLTEAALDSGLPPSEVRRQIDCGLEHSRQAQGGPEP